MKPQLQTLAEAKKGLKGKRRPFPHTGIYLHHRLFRHQRLHQLLKYFTASLGPVAAATSPILYRSKHPLTA